jgi:hypothetical protein
MHGPINFKSANNISKWQMRFNSAFKGLNIRDARADLPCFDKEMNFWLVQAIIPPSFLKLSCPWPSYYPDSDMPAPK